MTQDLIAPSALADDYRIELSAATDEVQSLSMTGAPNGGNALVTWPGKATVTAAYNETHAALQTALDTAFGAGNTNVTGGPLPGTPLAIEFKGDLAGASPGLPVIDDTALVAAAGTPHAHVAVTTPVGGDVKVLGENMGRAGIIASADGTDVWLSYGTGKAEVGKGVCVRAGAGTHEYGDDNWRGEVHAISAGSATFGLIEKLYFRGDGESEREPGADTFVSEGASDATVVASPLAFDRDGGFRGALAVYP